VRRDQPDATPAEIDRAAAEALETGEFSAVVLEDER